MLDSGLREVENPSEMLLSGRPQDASGTCVTCVMEGARPVLAEIQALVAPSAGARPLRSSNGFDYNRAAMLLAVLEKRGGLKVSQCDAYLNIIGGLSLPPIWPPWWLSLPVIWTSPCPTAWPP